MYPFIRFAIETLKALRAPQLAFGETHVSHHRIYPWDLDPWVELNNGRTLTLYDLGRMPMALRTGMSKVLRQKGWGITVAGVSVRYRRRLVAFERFEMRSRPLGWDARFIYMEQTLWKGGDCANQMLLRSAITSKAGIVPPVELMRAMGYPEDSPALPAWAEAWIEADAQRPWPPERV